MIEWTDACSAGCLAKAAASPASSGPLPTEAAVAELENAAGLAMELASNLVDAAEVAPPSAPPSAPASDDKEDEEAGTVSHSREASQQTPAG